MKSICIYCGSSMGKSDTYKDEAIKLADALVAQQITLVYGGASVGIMGVIANRVLAGGGKVIGVIPNSLVEREVCHEGLSELIVVADMHARKAKMAELADGFIALPGGLGTLDELCEILTWSQLGIHNKPCAALNVEGYFDSLVGFFQKAVDEEFMKQQHKDMLMLETNAEDLIAKMIAYKPLNVSKWIRRN